MWTRSDGSAARPLRCAAIRIEAAHQGGSGCGLFLYAAFALAWMGMGLVDTYGLHQFERRSEPVLVTVQATVNQAWTVSFTPSDGRARTLSLRGRRAQPADPLQPARWFGRGRGRLELLEDLQQDHVNAWVVTGVGALMGLHVMLLVRAWSRDARRRERVQRLNQRVPALRWTCAGYRSGHFKRYRITLVFMAPDGLHYAADSEEFNVDPQPRMHAFQPQVLLDPANPRMSVVDQASLPPVFGG